MPPSDPRTDALLALMASVVVVALLYGALWLAGALS